MTLYLDASALMKLYVDEAGSAECERILLSDVSWITARHTEVEVRRNLARALAGSDRVRAQEQFQKDWNAMSVIELDRVTCGLASEVAETTGARTLDALHLGAVRRAGGRALAMVTYDLRLAHAARSLGLPVLGA